MPGKKRFLLNGGKTLSDVEKNYRLTCLPKTASGPRPVSYLTGRKFNIASESSKRRAKMSGRKNRIFLSSSVLPLLPMLAHCLLTYLHVHTCIFMAVKFYRERYTDIAVIIIIILADTSLFCIYLCIKYQTPGSNV